MTVLETENLTHYYENGMAGAVAAIENINVKFEKGEMVIPAPVRAPFFSISTDF